jgi:Lipase (class 3)
MAQSVLTSNPQSLTYPITDPPAGYMDNAKVCSFLVNVACDMCQQWLQQGQPSPDSFNWVPNDPCPYTSQYNLDDFDLNPSALETSNSIIWSTFQYQNQTYTEPFGFIAMTAGGGAFYLVFRGSQTSVDFDLDGEDPQVPYPGGPPAALVEQGFAAVFAGCSDAIKQALLQLSIPWDGDSERIFQYPFFITGHSLGSALATLSVPLMAPYQAKGMQCNQASPRVGNPAFAELIDSFADLGFPTYRLVNTADLVPKLPPPEVLVDHQKYSYQHVGTEVDFTAAYATEKDKHSPCCSYSYALFNPTYPVNPNITQCVNTLEPSSKPVEPQI